MEQKFNISNKNVTKNTALKYKTGSLRPTFLLFFTVTRLTPVTTFMPSFCMAFLLFFSLRLCLDLPLASPPGHYEKDVIVFVEKTLHMLQRKRFQENEIDYEI
jgi:hypothetical protein